MRKETSTNFQNEQTVHFECPFVYAISMMGKRWKPAILWKIGGGLNRFGELRRAIHPITEKMLAQHLRELESDGLIEKQEITEMPVRTAYSLTSKGKSLKPILMQLKTWSEEHASR